MSQPRNKPMKSFSMKLTEDHIKFLLDYGAGNLANAVRKLIDEKISTKGRTFVELTHVDPFNRTIVHRLSDTDNSGDGPEGTDPLCIADKPSDSEKI